MKYFDTVDKKTKDTKANSIYICGPTLYRPLHLGNLRPIIFGDYLNRALKTKYVSNVTDIDDKILAKTSIKKYIPFVIGQLLSYRKLQYALGIKAHKEYSVFKDMDLIIKYIENHPSTKQEKDIRLYFDYNDISRTGAGSFAIWKFTQRGFNTKLGRGLPGWHTECACFIEDIQKDSPLCLHGGGKDLKDLHHQNECHLLDSSCGCGRPKGWIHTGMLNITNIKMSKSNPSSMISAAYFINKYGYIRTRLIFMNTIYYEAIDLHPCMYKEIENLNSLFHWSNAKSNGTTSVALKNYCLKNTFKYSVLVHLVKKYKNRNPNLTKQIFNFLGIHLEFDYNDCMSVVDSLRNKYKFYRFIKEYEKSDRYREILNNFLRDDDYNYAKLYDRYNRIIEISN